MPHDWFVYTATKQFFSGMRIRKYCAGLLTDLWGEESAKEIFEWLERGMNALDQAFFAEHPNRRYRIRLATSTEIAECRKAGTTFPTANSPNKFIHALISRTGITVCVVMPLRSGEASEEQSKLLWNAAFEVACAAGKIAAERGQ